MCVCAGVCMFMCVCECVNVSIYSALYRHIRAYTYISTHAGMHAGMHACTLMYIHVYIHTLLLIHTYIHIYIYIHVYGCMCILTFINKNDKLRHTHTWKTIIKRRTLTGIRTTLLAGTTPCFCAHLNTVSTQSRLAGWFIWNGAFTGDMFVSSIHFCADWPTETASKLTTVSSS